MDRNTKTVLGVLGMIAFMTVLVINAPALYRTFCQITGFDGTTRKADAASTEVLERKVTIRFDASMADNLPWSFHPAQVSQTLHIGESSLAFYEAENRADYPVIGTASYNVQPAKAGQYFMKVECFCFTEQLLAPGEKVQMPVTYFIDPAMADDRSLDEVREITLSYTFYRNEVAEKRLAAAGGGAAPGSK
ncbi:cytochrome c oxidase assembly protein [Parvularcula marina]|uniref:cytochrome c oxidase assembly protein n=1 Tax=Parvularcula marina TaxID=2292771 RepID=UPI00351424C3